MKKILFILFLLIANWQITNAQTKPAVRPTTTKPPVKIKYKGKTYWKNYVDSATVSVEEALALLNQPIIVKNDKNVTFTIVSYQFLYRKLGVTEDEETGKISPASTIASRRFDKTPLSQIWQDSITEQLHSGEELEFFDVVIKNPTGGMTISTNLKIKIK